MVRVKICGITNLEDALLSSKEGADALGFIFTKKSPRYITPTIAKKIIFELGPLIVKVGVFVDEDKEKVSDLAASIGLDVLQFHGSESSSYCQFFTDRFKVIKTFFPQDRPFKEKLMDYKVDAFLFDIKYEEKVRGKKILPKEELAEIKALIKQDIRVIMSGGLNVNNISQIKKIAPYGIDVASGVEDFVGKKDKELVRLFIRKAKNEIT